MVPAVDVNGNAVFEVAPGMFLSEDPDNPGLTAGSPQAMNPVVTVTEEEVNVQASGTNSTENVTFLAEIGLFGTYQIRPNFHFRAAYDFILLAGVGTAGDNASLRNGFGAFNVGSSAFFHGGSFGFETSW